MASPGEGGKLSFERAPSAAAGLSQDRVRARPGPGRAGPYMPGQRRQTQLARLRVRHDH